MKREFLDEVWTTNDGRQLNVAEMEDEHVRDALRLMLRNKRKKQEIKTAIAVLVDEMKRQDDAAECWGRS